MGEAGGSQLALTRAASADPTQPRKSPTPTGGAPPPRLHLRCLESWGHREKDGSQQGFRFRAFLTWLPIWPRESESSDGTSQPRQLAALQAGSRFSLPGRALRDSCGTLAEPQCPPGSVPSPQLPHPSNRPTLGPFSEKSYNVDAYSLCVCLTREDSYHLGSLNAVPTEVRPSVGQQAQLDCSIHSGCCLAPPSKTKPSLDAISPTPLDASPWPMGFILCTP